MGFAGIAIDVVKATSAHLHVNGLEPKGLEKIDQRRVVSLIAGARQVAPQLENGSRSNMNVQCPTSLEFHAYDILVHTLEELVVPLLEELLHDRHEDVIDM